MSISKPQLSQTRLPSIHKQSKDALLKAYGKAFNTCTAQDIAKRLTQDPKIGNPIKFLMELKTKKNSLGEKIQATLDILKVLKEAETSRRDIDLFESRLLETPTQATPFTQARMQATIQHLPPVEKSVSPLPGTLLKSLKNLESDVQALEIRQPKKNALLTLILRAPAPPEQSQLDRIQTELTQAVQQFESDTSLSTLQHQLKKLFITLTILFSDITVKQNIINEPLWKQSLDKFRDLNSQVNDLQDSRSEKSYHTGSEGWSSGSESNLDGENNRLSYTEKTNQAGIKIRFVEDDPRCDFRNSFSYYNAAEKKWSTPLTQSKFQSVHRDITLPSLVKERISVQVYSPLHGSESTGKFSGSLEPFSIQPCLNRVGGVTEDPADRGNRNDFPILGSNQIVSLSDITHQKTTASFPDTPIFVTSTGKHVLKQEGSDKSNNCGPTCIAMLALDLGSPTPDIGPTTVDISRPMQIDTLDEYLPTDLKMTITECLTNGTDNVLEKLEDTLREKGSVLIGLNNPAHYIIIDALQDDRVILRDPWHGWSVQTHTETLLNMIGTSAPLQMVTVEKA